jgi:hypothetical protein
MYFRSLPGICTIILIIFSAVAGHSQDTTAILDKAPRLPFSENEVQAAVDVTKQTIKNINTAGTLFDKFMIVGPRLWNKIKNENDFKNIEEGNVTFKVPRFDASGKWTSKEDVKGKALQDRVHYLKLWTYIKQNFNLEEMQVVDKNNKDKFIYWLYFAKIEEPVIAVQSDKARLMLSYTKGKLFFIELTSE